MPHGPPFVEWLILIASSLCHESQNDSYDLIRLYIVVAWKNVLCSRVVLQSILRIYLQVKRSPTPVLRLALLQLAAAGAF